MFRRHHDDLASIDELLGWSPEPVQMPASSKPRALLSGIASVALLGAIVAVPVVPFAVTGALAVNAAQNYWDELPTELPDVVTPTRSVILAADGTRIAQFYSENRVPVTSEQVPDRVRNAIIAIEDSRFYEHAGVDLRGTARALVRNTLTDRTEGGSTLTQQYVKNVLASAAEDNQARQAVTSRTSHLRKLREAKLALALEKHKTKDEILLGYLNIAYFGGGAYGVGTAARRYFNKDVADVTLAEAALLAGLVQNPSGLAPTRHRKAAKQRRDVVLGRMFELGHVSERAYRKAVASKLRLTVTATPNGCTSSQYPFFCQWVRTELETSKSFGRTQAQRNERLFRGGMTIRTTLDPAKQEIAQRAVDGSLGRDNRVASVVVVVEPGTGHVVAMAQNRTWGTSDPGRFDKTEIVLGTTPAMQPGSNFKPITLAAALERGFDPSTRIMAPYSYTPANQASPPGGFKNSTSSGTGSLDAYQATARSSNTWFVKIQEQVGVLNVAAMAERLGMPIPRTGSRAITSRDASLTLGAYETSPVALAGAYATFAAHGIHCTPVPVSSITGADGQSLPAPSANCHEAIPASVADTVAQAMAGTIGGNDPGRTGKAQAIGRPAAGKTGTTTGNAAVWFSGFTPQYATAVWVGDPRGGFRYPLRGFYANGSYVPRAYGGLVAGPIWKAVMDQIHQGMKVERFVKPSTTVSAGTVAPDVRGLTLDQAYRALTSAGYVVALDEKNAPADKILPADRVHSTSPPGGSMLGLRSTIRIMLTNDSDRNVRLPRNP